MREAAELAREHEDLLMLLTTLRGASGEALSSLYFDARLEAKGRATAFVILADLVRHHLLARQEVLQRRSIYHLGSAALVHSSRVRARVSDTFRKPMRDGIAGYCWLRSSMWAALRAEGYVVGRGRDEQVAVRRFLVDTQRKTVAALSGGARDAAARVLEALRSDRSLAPLFRSRCRRCKWKGALCTAAAECKVCRGPVEHVASPARFECTRCGFFSDAPQNEHWTAGDRPKRCEGNVREADHLAYDVAWKADRDRYDVVLLFVDHPGEDLAEALRALPLRIAHQPRVPIILRTTDPKSTFNRASGRWAATGERHRLLLRAFSDEGDENMFPFVTTTRVVDFRPEIQLRTLSRKAKEDE